MLVERYEQTGVRGLTDYVSGGQPYNLAAIGIMRPLSGSGAALGTAGIFGRPQPGRPFSFGQALQGSPAPSFGISVHTEQSLSRDLTVRVSLRKFFTLLERFGQLGRDQRIE
jgi:hypothetical protein